MLAGPAHSNDMQFLQGQDQPHGAMYARNANDGIMHHQYKRGILYIRMDTLNKKKSSCVSCSDDDQFNERSIKEQEHGKLYNGPSNCLYPHSFT